MRRCLHIAMHSRYVKKGRSRFVVAARAIPTLGKIGGKIRSFTVGGGGGSNLV